MPFLLRMCYLPSLVLNCILCLYFLQFVFHCHLCILVLVLVCLLLDHHFLCLIVCHLLLLFVFVLQILVRCLIVLYCYLSVDLGYSYDFSILKYCHFDHILILFLNNYLLLHAALLCISQLILLSFVYYIYHTYYLYFLIFQFLLYFYLFEFCPLFHNISLLSFYIPHL